MRRGFGYSLVTSCPWFYNAVEGIGRSEKFGCCIRCQRRRGDGSTGEMEAGTEQEKEWVSVNRDINPKAGWRYTEVTGARPHETKGDGKGNVLWIKGRPGGRGEVRGLMTGIRSQEVRRKVGGKNIL